MKNNEDRGEAVPQTCSVKKVFLEISQNSQENTCARVFSKNTFFYRTPLEAASDRGNREKKKKEN